MIIQDPRIITWMLDGSGSAHSTICTPPSLRALTDNFKIPLSDHCGVKYEVADGSSIDHLMVEDGRTIMSYQIRICHHKTQKEICKSTTTLSDFV